jgi:hypothetical protein
MPMVQPKAATMLARKPRERPVASVKITPVPGDTTTMNEVTRNSRLTVDAPFAAATHRTQHGPAGEGRQEVDCRANDEAITRVTGD